MKRITVIGTTGSGKTTLAQQLAICCNYPCIDLDAIHWGPHWTPSPPDAFRERVQRLLEQDCWVVAGNYSVARDMIWSRSDTLIWLDYSLAIVLWRLFRRTVRRVITKEVLYAGNYEPWKEQFFSRESLLWYAIQTHAQRRIRFATQLTQPEYAHLNVKRFTHPRATAAWFRQLQTKRQG